MIVFHCLDSSGLTYTMEGIQLLLVEHRRATETEASIKEDDMTKTGTHCICSDRHRGVCGSFHSAGGFIADDHPNAGTAILARKFAFRAFVVSDTMAFVCSIVATCFLIYGGARAIPPNHRSLYNRLASGAGAIGGAVHACGLRIRVSPRARCSRSGAHNPRVHCVFSFSPLLLPGHLDPSASWGWKSDMEASWMERARGHALQPIKSVGPLRLFHL
ncbi:hypothetical protein C2845_PM03G09050 [Panicum miliaceum]|uniref:PGG domain-containing protein n=1 Tax=Panicum miliaceum TaxID=4540 RepID=A0A3L6TEX0_PANMI|nr:hypothetical protein C2845_PM03G09050 [Panicum miliaceum]